MAEIEISPDTISMSDRSDAVAGLDELRLVQQACDSAVEALSDADLDVSSITAGFFCCQDGLRTYFCVRFSILPEQAFEAQTEVGLSAEQSQEDGNAADWLAKAATTIVFAVRLRLTMELTSNAEEWDESAREVAQAFLSAPSAEDSTEP